MDILYIGYLFPEKEYEINKALSFAAGRFENGFISGLKENRNINISILSIEPQEKKFPFGKFFIKKRRIDIINVPTKSISLSYINIPFIKHAYLFLGIVRYINLWAKRNPKNKHVLVSYNADVPIIQVGLYAQKRGIEYFPILSDLPFYDEKLIKRSFSQILSMIAYKSQIKNLHKLTNAIVLNVNSAIDFHIPNYIVVDGAISRDEEEMEFYLNPKLEKKVLYCGCLDKFHGTDILIEVAKKITSVDFIICGRGDEMMVRALNESAIKYKNLKYYGAVNNKKLVELQKMARLLIIPHSTKYKQARYQFPSKLLTCLSTGIPVLVTPTPGISDEYRKYLIMTENDSVDSISSEIKEYFSKNEEYIYKMGSDARYFVLCNKTWKIQTKKIVSFILKGKDA